jgi:acyl-coenzyme A synthetase/AMP-(fatty) acid ligase
MFIDFLIAVFAANLKADAVVWQDRVYDYGWLLAAIRSWQERLKNETIGPGMVTVLEADFSPNAIALFLALVETGCILVPMTAAVRGLREEFLRIAEAETIIRLDADDQATVQRLGTHAVHPLYAELRSQQRPGLVLFSSGSTGQNKAAVHDLVSLLKKFEMRRHARRTIAFLMFDHIGGINTMLYTLSNAGCMVVVHERSPDAVLRAVETHRVQLLPTSPTFLNLILLGESYKCHDLSSLEMISYGTEPMPESTLKRFHQLYPKIELRQTYGLSEVGILRSKSKTSDSLWMKIGGEGFQTRVVDGILHIRSQSAMLGYLNAPSPFTEDGWFVTGDAVEQVGEYFRILGHNSKVINVGGEKVYPAEVESVIQELENIASAMVYAEPNPIIGNIVCANVSLQKCEDSKVVARRVKQGCRAHLQPFKVPVKVTVVEQVECTPRFKKSRQWR